MQISAKATLGLAKETANSWSADYAPSMGAALSYYTLFSIAPLLLIAIAIAGFVFGEEAARGQIFGQLSGMVGPEGAKAIDVFHITKGGAKLSDVEQEALASALQRTLEDTDEAAESHHPAQ